MAKKNCSTFLSLMLHLLILGAALLINSIQTQSLIPSRSNGMEVSLIAPAALNPTSMVVKLEKNVQQDRIQNTNADVNFKQQQDQKNIANQLLQPKQNPNTPAPPVPVPSPVKTDKPAKANKTRAPTSNQEINDLISDLSPATNGGRSKGLATSGSNLGTSNSNNLAANYADQVIALVRPFVSTPDGLDSHAKAVVEVTLLPNMKVYKVRLIKTSGNAGYDSNIQQAIMRAAIFPPLPQGSSFANYRTIKLTFRPE